MCYLTVLIVVHRFPSVRPRPARGSAHASSLCELVRSVHLFLSTFTILFCCRVLRIQMSSLFVT